MNLIPLGDAEWDGHLKSSPYSTFFHTSFWKNAVCECIGGSAQLLKCRKGNREWLLPIFRGSSWSQSFRLSSIGYGGPIPLQRMVSAADERQNFVEILCGLEREWGSPCSGTVTFPCTEWSTLDVPSGQWMAETEVIPLHPHPDAVFHAVVTGNVRTSVRRAAKNGVVIRRLNAGELEAAGLLLESTQRVAGASYTTPKTFLKYLFDHPMQGATLWGAFDSDNGLQAMSVLLTHAETAFHLFHGWRRAVDGQGANQALIWEMVKHGIVSGCREFNMGESHSAGLKRAKRQWGTRSYPILKFRFPA